VDDAGEAVAGAEAGALAQAAKISASVAALAVRIRGKQAARAGRIGLPSFGGQSLSYMKQEKCRQKSDAGIRPPPCAMNALGSEHAPSHVPLNPASWNKLQFHFKHQLRCLMNIGELAKRLNMATSKIRFYEAAGLLGTVKRRDNGFRRYDEQAIVRLAFIRDAQNAGLGLDSIRALLPVSSTAPRSEAAQRRVLKALQSRLTAIEATQAQLRTQRSELQAAIARLQAELPADAETKQPTQQSLL
jgi:DNA-binding transcriptional MerR regulator